MLLCRLHQHPINKILLNIMDNFGKVLSKLMEAAELITLNGSERKKYVLAELEKKLEGNPNKDILLSIADNTIDTLVVASLGKLGINKDNLANIQAVIKSKLEGVKELNDIFTIVVKELDKIKKLSGKEKKALAMTITKEWIAQNRPDLKDAVDLIDLSIESTVKISHQIKKRCCKN
jgi:hypothetical protein